MPISRENQARYPKNWKKEVVPRIRARSGDRCECEGECGDGIGEHGGRCTAENRKPHPLTKSIVVLTVAHLNHTPEDCRDEVLRHMCQRCHLRYDRDHHQKNARATRFRKVGQDDLGL